MFIIKNKGFTLIELLMVIAIIGVLSSIVFSSLSQAKGKANDARRKLDLKQIQLALELYHSQCGTYAVAQNCTEAAYGCGGYGYFNQDYTEIVGCGSVGSVAQGLVNSGAIGNIIIDPSGQITSDGTRSGYMIAADANYYTLWANLQSPSATDATTLNSCHFDTYDEYHESYPETARTNYCISN